MTIETSSAARMRIMPGINFVSRNHVLRAAAVLGPGSEAHEVNLNRWKPLMGAILQGDAAKNLVLCGSQGSALGDFGCAVLFSRATAVVAATLA